MGRGGEEGTVPVLPPARPAGRYEALVVDHDGTIALDGRIDHATLAALERSRRGGWRLLLGTSRPLSDIRALGTPLELFDRVVAESGGVVFDRDGPSHTLGPPPPEELVAALIERGVAPLDVGEVTIATAHPNQSRAAHAIRELGLDYRVVFNQRRVLILPSSISSASTVAGALDELGVSPQQAVGVGDAQDDVAFLSLCGLAVAVANALPSVKMLCHAVTTASAGAGVRELLAALPHTLRSNAA